MKKNQRLLPTCLRFAALGLAATALAQPVITTQPRTQFQWENKRVSLDVRPTGTAPFRYQWQFNGADLAGATNRVFSLPRVQLTNDGNYRVVVTDGVGGVITSEVARLLVRAWPEPTGPRIQELAGLDANMQTAMLNNALPGASLAVLKDGRLVFARGYGFADIESNEQYQPDTLCRGGSLAKTLTAATAMMLAEEGKLDLDAPVLPLLALVPPDYPGATLDERWTNVTTRRVLYHTGGWDGGSARNPLGALGFDSSVWSGTIAKDLNLPGDATSVDLVRWMMGKPLQFKPGARFQYSNFGYDLVGVLIERLTQGSDPNRPAPWFYERSVREFLRRADITRLLLAGNGRSERQFGEATCYLHPALSPASVTQYESRPFNADLPYAWPIRLYAADGGWLISAIDYARFVAAIDGDPAYPDILTTNSVAAMLARASSPSTSGDGYYGMGWDVVRPSIKTWYKAGADTGSGALAYKYLNGVIAVYTVNTWWDTDNSLLWDPLSQTLNAVRSWPGHDLFPLTLSHEAWRRIHFSPDELALPSVSDDYADPDSDGVPNLVEFALDSDPRTTSPQPPITIQIEPGGSDGITISYPRLLVAHEIDYQLQQSNDLKEWRPAELQGNSTTISNSHVVSVARLRNSPQLSPSFFRLGIKLHPRLRGTNPIDDPDAEY